MLVLVFFYLLLPLVQLVFFLHAQLFVPLSAGMNFGASIFALHWLLANVVFSAKIPVLQKSIAYDQRIRFHILSTAGIAAAVLYHAVYKFGLGFQINYISWLLLVILITMLSLALLWIPVPGFRSVRSWVMSRMKSSANYDRSKGLHRLFVLVIGLVLLLHIIQADLFESVSPVSSMLYVLLYGFSFASYLLSLTGLFRTKAEILDIEEKQGIVSITLSPRRHLHYRSGQFTFLGVRTAAGHKEEHPFSFLSAPGAVEKVVAGGPAPVRLAIRAMGDFTRELTAMRRGDSVWLRGAYGNFRPGKEDALCFIASGIGTVPVLSNIQELHARGDSRPIRLFLAVNHREEIPDFDRIRMIAKTMPNLSLTLMVFPEDGLRYSEEFFRETLTDHLQYTYYLCSSPGVRKIVYSALTGMGIRKSDIHYEAFSFG